MAVGKTSGGDATRIIYYKCGHPGHMQVDCLASPFCVNCKKEGHISTVCSIFSKLQEPLWAGFGGDDVGFYCCEVAEDELEKLATNSAILCIESGNLAAAQVEA
jgi:predicted NBD/HSP70 family sugar kinase